MTKTVRHICMTGIAPSILGAFVGVLLSGCAASDDRYPSLAVRDAERVSGTLNPGANGTPDASQTPKPADLRPLQAASQRAQAANTRFTSLSGDVRAAIAAAQGVGPDNDRHSRALAGLAQLTSLRAQTGLALADIDLLEVKAASTFSQTREIRETQSAILRLVKAQDETLDSLATALTP